ncbi:MAG: von Willebrand factor, partial [Verrucomicrobiales bacterium]|nr:von Willebrand factor [Verrucomicrobiales bacterium]
KEDDLADRDSLAENVANRQTPRGVTPISPAEPAKSNVQNLADRGPARAESLQTSKGALLSESEKVAGSGPSARFSVGTRKVVRPASEPAQVAAIDSLGILSASSGKSQEEIPSSTKPAVTGIEGNVGLSERSLGSAVNRTFAGGAIGGAAGGGDINGSSAAFGRGLGERVEQAAKSESQESKARPAAAASRDAERGWALNNQPQVTFDSLLNDQIVTRAPEQVKLDTRGDVSQFGLAFKEQKDLRDLGQKPDAGSALAPGLQTMPGLKTSTGARGTSDFFRTDNLEASANVPASTVAPLVQDARLLMETGKLDEAEAKLKQAAKKDPENQGAFYYLKLLTERRYQQEARKREIVPGEAMLTVERSWNTPLTRDSLPSPLPLVSRDPLSQKAKLSEQAQGPNEIEKLGKQIDKQGKSQSGLVELRSETRSADEASARLKNRFATEESVNRPPPAGAAGRPILTEQKVELVERQADVAQSRPASPPAIPQPEVESVSNPISTFSLNVADVSFKLAAASLEKGVRPDPATIRSEEFVNAFNYRDPEAASGVPIAFAWDRAQYPFAHNRDILRLSVRTAAKGREAGRPLNLVLLLDNSGSMERADRVRIIHEALAVLARQLQPQDRISVVTFARTARLWIDGLPGDKAGELAEQVGGLAPDGGTNLEEALNLAYATAAKHFSASAANRVVLLTDGAANLGDVSPDSLKQKVESWRRRGIALDCFGIGWEGFNDDLLEVLSRNGDGRYGFVNTPEEAATGFATQLAGALQVAASDVKVQVEFNPQRVTAWRQIGYAKHQLTKEQFRDNTVDAAELAAAETGNALYVIQVNANGSGAIGTVRVRYREPQTGIFHEQAWPVSYNGTASRLDQAAPSLRLATAASAFSEWLASSPFAGEVTPDALLPYMQGVPAAFDPDPRPTQLEWMIRQAKSVFGQ